MWLYKLERKFKFLKIPNLMLIIVVISALVYMFDVAAVLKGKGMLISKLLCFDRDLILKGEVWRAVTFIFIVSRTGRWWLTFLSLYFYYFVGKSLQVTWGDFKFTVYYLTGVLGAVLGGFLVGGTSVDYLNLSLFFAFAALFPNLEVLFMFFIPVKVKWLAYIDAVFFGFKIIVSLVCLDFSDVVAAIMAIINFLIFFGPRFFIDIFKKLKFYGNRFQFLDDNGNNRRKIKRELKQAA